MSQKSQKEDRSKKRIVITGGHAATVAISIIEELIRRSQKGMSWDIYWIGTEFAFEGKKIKTLEHQVLPKLGINYSAIISGRLQRKFTLWTIPSLVKIPVGFIQTVILLRRIKPDLILSLGGFVAFPVVVIGYLMRIPVIIHEQTTVIGRANKASIPFADKILISRKSSEKYFPTGKLILVGHPIMTQIAEIAPKSQLGSPPTIYISGGSRGSKEINSVIKEILTDLLEKYIVVHQTGYNDYSEFKEIKDNLTNNLSSHYEIYANIDPMQVDGVIKRADLIIARAGASTTAEIVASKRLSILIPLRISYMNEQMKNAIFTRKHGLAKIIRSKVLNAKILLAEIKDSFSNWTKIMHKVDKNVSSDIYAAKKIVDILEEY